jgi:acyl-CoA reductase-like NAD-dependent aldehyde dehydrogenase
VLFRSADVVSFTGSVPVGHEVAVAAARRGIPAQAEMGGQNASIVLPDADIASAATTIASAAMGYAGQKCTATSRVIVVGDPEPFTEALVEAVRQLDVGDPADPGNAVGPVITERARDNVTDAAAQAETEGGKVVVGGTPLDREGTFVAPTLVTGLASDATRAQEEVFGPIAAVLGARDQDDAVRTTNGVRYGCPSLDDVVVEYVDHLHEHFCDPVEVRDGRWLLPALPGYSAEIARESRQTYRFPAGSAWAG